MFSFLKRLGQKDGAIEKPNFDESNWQQTSQAAVFFDGYQSALKIAESQEKAAQVETLKAQYEPLQQAFLKRLEARLKYESSQIENQDERDQYIIDQIKAVRAYTSEMPITVRTRLAELKHHLFESD
ncbi:GTP-binding protein [Eupransor demetentiae]|uniref:Uncharacterized protein n=1 Tax=Eupransor demetentiae TaxID=3109584 RepID=A0ABP0EQ12_9LACO|nr:hypothetical protein R54876_GBNLAHCA_00877 [Lactobacillaceae bacterium LMG 33000]